jgi:hypothetical protein
MATQTSGPYVNAFFLCHKLEAQPNGAVTAQGIQNRFKIESDLPELPPGTFIRPHIYIRFETGGHGQSAYTVRVDHEDSLGATKTLFTRNVAPSEGVDGGTHLIERTTNIVLTHPGIHLLRLFVDGVEVSQSSFTVRYTQVPRRL